MKDEDKTKAELIKELKPIRKEREKSTANNIADRKQAEEKLQDSEEYLKKLFEYAPDAYYVNDLKGNFIDGNLAAERIIGLKREELIGKNILKLKLLSIKDIPKATKSIAKNIMGLATGPEEYVIIRKDKSTVAVEISSYPVKIKGKTYILGIARDITERKKAEKVLAESEERYRTVFENTGTAMLVIEEDLTVSMVNTQCEKLSGYSKEEIENKMKWTDFVVSEDLERMKKYHIARRQAGEKPPTEYEFRMADKKGAVKDIFMKIGMVPHSKKSVASLTDITQRKQAEEELRLHAAIMDNVAEGICLTGLDDLLIKWTNEKFARMFGNEPGELIGKHVDIIDAPAEEKTSAKTRTSIEDVIRKTGEWHGEVRNIKRDGTHLWCYANVSLFDHPKYGKVTVSVNTDITEHKLAEDSVKNAKDELQTILDSVPAIIFYKDTKDRFVRINKTMADSLKVQVKDILGKTTEELFPKEQAEQMKKDDQEVIISGKIKKSIIQPYTTPDGIKFLSSDKIPYQDEKGKIIGVIGLAKDITEQRKSEQELLQSYQKLKKTMNATIEIISKIVEAKDPYTAGHQLKVSQLATAIAKELNLSPDKVEGIRIASLIHDIGKIGLPTEILSKPTRLSDLEFSLIKEHPQIGYNTLKSIDFSYPVANIVLQHHERMDGSGYPSGLSGENILVEARILGVADTVEAMSSFRPYRPALGIDAALEEISKNRGILYDPKVVDSCLKLFKEKGFKFE